MPAQTPPVPEIIDGMIGQIALFAFQKIPENWLACDGTAINTADYPLLFRLIGQAYNKENEKAGTFRLPDLRNAVPIHNPAQRGPIVDSALADAPAIKLTKECLPSHTHTPVSTDGISMPVDVALTILKKTGANVPTEGGFLGAGGTGAPIHVKKEDAEGAEHVTLNGGAAVTMKYTPSGTLTLDEAGTETLAPVTIPYVGMSWCICYAGTYPVFR
ncbi:phage tail protein [Prosthecomicrobium pneumaticum]|uniref:Microcystin-dependent protein n=1 Tax=Prosthecomicrobium pneumaticum TaxID=81895 RepID=A0A7W9FLH6_9HYPH|nr:phage tail protein [Prosthecomicrobium pneumaticum]MBB5752869.1 microcystin-dependent protein [Prosthecomicrobium pneumaticum]